MFQSITLVGNLGGDVELKQTPSGIPVASFNLAVNKSWVNADGERKEKALWIRITAWRKLAETASQYLAKGNKVMVVGEVEEARPWTDRDGKQRASLEVTASTIKFLDTPKGNGAGEPVQDGGDIPF